MGRILDMARADTARILNNGGFDNQITIVKDASSYSVKGITPVHHLSFDTDGNSVNSKNAHVTLAESDLLSAGFNPRNTSNEVFMLKVLVSFADSAGITRTYTVKENYADETIGTITLILGKYAT